MKDVKNESRTKFEKQVDVFLNWPSQKFQNFIEKTFQYTYRECISGTYCLFLFPDNLRKATRLVREKGFTNFDCFTPFPIHGLEHDMGLPRSRLPYVTFFAGLTGFLLALALQSFVHHPILAPVFSYFDAFPNFRSYPLNISGKPTFSWPAMIPILFELTVLLGGLATVFFLILVCRLFRSKRKSLDPDITNDKFCLWVPSDSKNYDPIILEKICASIEPSAKMHHLHDQEKQ